jgi:hypothetical protein
MSDIKQIQVSGEALTSLTGYIKTGGGTRRKTRKAVGLPVRAVEILENESSNTNTFNFIKHDTHSIPIHNEKKEIIEVKEIIPPNDNIIKEKVKVVLAPKKKKEHRVILSRKRKNIQLENKVIGGSINKTRKVSFNLLRHKKRLTRAKKIFDESNKLSIDKIKKQLVAKNIIKSTSKAPESVLRQIYNDALVVANKAL